ncbi:SCO3374 family protein [Streptomyces leeuwenhoekii]|uniref:Proline-Rich Protein n=1 Tax=Streptomyces leeuwenhoekii TaxID=1437453 RepID=A0A0F7VQF2_STRLW|nr:SCO3374 family protein [Streptomyces leeuwenhoekii]CQR62659.1 Proline-Rich Protein [Streptomyces leeuwenhoekii]
MVDARPLSTLPVPPALPVPPPRRPRDPLGRAHGERLRGGGDREGTRGRCGCGDPADRDRRWYEHRLGWPTAPGEPLRLRTGVRFDVLDVPAQAGFAALGRLGPLSPVAVQGGRMRLFVAPGSAEELPGLLDWLEWGSLALDLAGIGAGGLIDAPPPPATGSGPVRPLPPGHPDRADSDPLAGADRRGPQGAAVWLRPPVPGCEVESSLPTLSALGGGGGAPDLVRLLGTVATACHRVRLWRASAVPPAGAPGFSPVARRDGGKRP